MSLGTWGSGHLPSPALAALPALYFILAREIGAERGPRVKAHAPCSVHVSSLFFNRKICLDPLESDLLEWLDPFLLVVMLTRAGGPALATDSWGGGTQPCPLWGSVQARTQRLQQGGPGRWGCGPRQVSGSAPGGGPGQGAGFTPTFLGGLGRAIFTSLEWLLLSLASGESHFLVLSSEPWAFTRAL